MNWQGAEAGGRCAQVSLQRLLSSPDSARRTLSAAAAAAFPAIARAAGQGGGAPSAAAGSQGGDHEGDMPAGFVPQQQSAFSVPASRRGARLLEAVPVISQQ